MAVGHYGGQKHTTGVELANGLKVFFERLGYSVTAKQLRSRGSPNTDVRVKPQIKKHRRHLYVTLTVVQGKNSQVFSLYKKGGMAPNDCLNFLVHLQEFVLEIGQNNSCIDLGDWVKGKKPIKFKNI